MKKIIKLTIFFFASIGVVLSGLLALVLFHPEIFNTIGLHEVSGELYTCMTYKDPVLIQQILEQGMNLKDAREIADAKNNVDAYTQCLEEIFGRHTVWVNENDFIIYD